jgi:phage/plasmid-like protein (TIGR03299 family)
MTTTLIPAVERASVMKSAGYSFSEPVGADRALHMSGMDWEVEKIPLAPQTTSLGVPVHGTERMAMVARKDNGKMLGVTGHGYEIFQNIDLSDFGQAVLDNGEAQIDSLGSWRGDRMVWMAFKLNGGIEIGGVDPVQTMLYLISSHDGKSSGLQAMLSSVRLFCTNQVPMLLRGAKGEGRHISLKHTANLIDRVEDAKRALRIGAKYTDQFQTQADMLLEQRMSGRQFNAFMDRLIPLTPKLQEDPESRPALNRLETIAAIRSIWDSAPNLENVRGSRWAAYNAVAEYEDWGRPTRTSNSGDTAAQSRHMRMVADNPVKDRALTLLTA